MREWIDRAFPAGWGVLLCASVLCLGLLTVAPTNAHAQEDGEAAADDDADQGGGEATSEAKKEKSLLVWAAQSLGYGYSIIFLALSFTLVALFVMNLLQSSRGNVARPELVESFDEHITAGNFSEAYELAASDDSMLGKVLSAGLSTLSGGGDYPKALEAMQEVGEEESMKIEHRLSYMALIGTISPMIGLMGTVQGMIRAFETISTTNQGAPSAQDLAGDISTALFTTFAGLIVAIPAIAAYNILRNRVARLMLEVGIVSEGLMSRFQKQS